jgi:hypothetical protein
MGKRKSTYRIFRDDDSDDANDTSIPQSQMISISGNRRKAVETPFSPQKKARRKEPVVSGEWEPSAEFESGYDGLGSEGFAVEGLESTVLEKVAAKRYPTSVSNESR